MKSNRYTCIAVILAFTGLVLLPGRIVAQMAETDEMPHPHRTATSGESSHGAAASRMTFVTPYAGEIENYYVDTERGLDLRDSSLLQGVYVQTIEPQRYQWNLFLYNSEDLNHSSLWGAHFIYDRYFNCTESTRDVIGAGLEYITLDMDAGASYAPLTQFVMKNDIKVWYLRAGRYYLFERGTVKGSILPWVGYEIDEAEGHVAFRTPNPFAPPVREDFDTDHEFVMAGLNLTARMYHFLHLKIKYMGRFGSHEYLDSTNVMLNVFMRKNWGISYRYKNMEFTTGSNTYNLVGILFRF